MDHSQRQPPDSASPSTSRKRGPREGETDSQRHKREKAAERQRRKRERDRRAGLQHILSAALEQEPLVPPEPAAPAPLPDRRKKDDESTAEDFARREKVRAAARERQRKHRALVKQRKMRELGLDMGNDVVVGVEELQFRIDEDGVYQQVIPHELQHPPHIHPQQQQQQQQPPPPLGEPPFPQGQVNGGQTFASTLLLSFSCAPLLKAHLLRTLNMTNEELASFEPIIAQAWDHWDQQRRLHYGGPKPPEPSLQESASAAAGSSSSTLVPPHPHSHPNPYSHPHPHPHPYGLHENDFRERFHRPLVAPSPFRSSVLGGAGGGGGGSTDSATPPVSASSASATSMEMEMEVERVVGGKSPEPALDPALGQARDEAAGVADRLSRDQ